MSQKDIVQYIAYFPPHQGGLESHAAQRAKRWVKQGYGRCLVATYDIGQHIQGSYTKDGYTVVTIPSYEIIPGFPLPRRWTTEYRVAHQKIRDFGGDILITRTRFFRTSWVGGWYAKKWRMKWVHIEHGVDYVKLNRRWKNILAWWYDQILGRIVFRMSEQLIAISEGCKHFARRFTKKDITVIYRGVEFTPGARIPSKGNLVRLGYVGRLTALKNVALLIRSLATLIDKGELPVSLELVGDGEERLRLEELVKELNLGEYVTFSGFQDRNYLENVFYPSIDICLNASLQEGLPTSLIEGLLAKCVVVATQVGGTAEISSQGDLLLVKEPTLDAYSTCLEQAVHTHTKLHGQSYEQVKKKFDWQYAIARYYELFMKEEA